jgi:transposase-like protein
MRLDVLMHGKETPLGIVSLERMFRQLEDWGQDLEDSRFGDLSVVVCESLKWVLEESFEWEVRHKTGCDIYERHTDRSDYRNGYRYRDILTRFGRLKDVKVPRLRQSGFVPSILSPGRLALADVEELVAKCLLCGGSRREVSGMLTYVLGYPPAGSLIARVEKQLDESANEFRTRKLTKRYQYLFLDGIWVKVRDAKSAKQRVVLVALAIDENGCKEVIGYARAQKESGAAWGRLLANLVERGLDYEKLKLVISDDAAGIARAIDDVFGDIDHQLCWAHRMRNIFEKVAESDRKDCIDGARKTYQAASRSVALRAFDDWQRHWAAKYPSLVAEMAKDLGKLLAFFKCPQSQWRYLRTSNPIERLNRDIRVRTFGWAGFQNKQSCDRLLYGVFWQRNNDWSDKPVLKTTH